MSARIRVSLSLLVLLAVMLLLSFSLHAQSTAKMLPYTAPTYQAVLEGKAPLRILVASHKTMLAWKGDGEVRAINLKDGMPLYTSPVGEQVGLAPDKDTKVVSLRKNNKNFCPAPGVIRLESASTIKLWTPAPDNWMVYPGPLIITPLDDGTFSVAREMPLEEYLRNVVPAEMPSSFHPQALRAQAVVARTYTLIELGRHADEGADLCATVHCQVLGAEAKRTKSTNDAVDATKGLVLLANGKLAKTYYHASCGGATDDAGYVWGPDNAQPYLTGTLDYKASKDEKACIENILAAKDPYCKGANSRWTRDFTVADVNALVSKNLGKVTGDPTVKIANVTNLAVESRTPFGRVLTLRVEGDGASVLVYGDQTRWLFGNGSPGADGLASTLYSITPDFDDNKNLTGYTITGAGRGHGLGLCQWGADGRAKAGQTYRQIIQAYYPGTKLSDEK